MPGGLFREGVSLWKAMGKWPKKAEKKAAEEAKKAEEEAKKAEEKAKDEAKKAEKKLKSTIMKLIETIDCLSQSGLNCQKLQ